MSSSKAKKIRKECRVYLEDLKSQNFKTRVAVAWGIIKGARINRVEDGRTPTNNKKTQKRKA